VTIGCDQSRIGERAGFPSPPRIAETQVTVLEILKTGAVTYVSGSDG
jgi:hypothetical protein